MSCNVAYKSNRCDWSDLSPEVFFGKFDNDTCLSLRGAVFEANWASLHDKHDCVSDNNTAHITWSPLEFEYGTLSGGHHVVVNIFLVFLMANTLLSASSQLGHRLFEHSSSYPSMKKACAVALNVFVQSTVLVVLMLYELVLGYTRNDDDVSWIIVTRVSIMAILWLGLGGTIAWRFYYEQFALSPWYNACRFVQGFLILWRLVFYPLFLVNPDIEYDGTEKCYVDEEWDVCDKFLMAELVSLGLFIFCSVLPFFKKGKSAEDKSVEDTERKQKEYELELVYRSLKAIFQFTVLAHCSILVYQPWCTGQMAGTGLAECEAVKDLDKNIPNLFILFNVFVLANILLCVVDFFRNVLEYNKLHTTKVSSRSSVGGILFDTFETILIIANMFVMLYIWLLAVEHKPSRLETVYWFGMAVGVLTFLEQYLFSSHQAHCVDQSIFIKEVVKRNAVSVTVTAKNTYNPDSTTEHVEMVENTPTVNDSFAFFSILLNVSKSVIVVSMTLFVLQQKYYARTGDTSNLVLVSALSILVAAGFADRFNSLKVVAEQ
jgi:hypothetical protein